MSEAGRANAGAPSEAGRANAGAPSEAGRANGGAPSEAGRADAGAPSEAGRADVGVPTGGGADPVLRVVRGHPTDAELAALLVVVLSRTAPATPPAAPTTSWSSRATQLRRSMYVGPGGWRAS